MELCEVVGKCKYCGRDEVWTRFGKWDKCSAFCNNTTQEEKDAYLNAKKGDEVIAPCRLCGTDISVIFDPDSDVKRCCALCYKSERLTTRTKLLDAVMRAGGPDDMDLWGQIIVEMRK